MEDEPSHMNDRDITLDHVFVQAKLESDKDDHECHVIELLRPYLNLRKDHADAWHLYGDALRVVGRFPEATAALEMAFALAPNDENRGFVCARMAMLKEQYVSCVEAENWYQKAVQLLVNPPSWLLMLRGGNLASMANFSGALECYQKAILEDDVDEDEAYLNMGLVLRALGQYEDALKAFRKALALNPTYARAHSAISGLEDIKMTLDAATKIR